MKLFEISNAQTLNEGVADLLKSKSEAIINKIKSISGIGPFLQLAEKQKNKLKEIASSCKDAKEAQASINSLAKTMANTQVAESKLDEGAGHLAIAALATLASGASILMAKAIGIYVQMGQPDVIQGSNLNSVGGIIFGILPPLMAATLAIIAYLEHSKSKQ